MPTQYERNRMAWALAARAQNAAATQLLRQRLPQYSIPIGDSRYTAPGHLFLGEYYYSYQDVAYPWDPSVLRSIREFEPTAMPVCIRSVWQRADYGNLEQPFVLIRHGIARAVRDPIIPLHSFRCELPIHPTRSLFESQPHSLAKYQPTYFEVNWYDVNDRPFGWDLPGQYKPFGWELYRKLYSSYENNRRGKDISDEYLDAHRTHKARKDKFDKEEGEYIERDVKRMQAKRASLMSDVDMKNAMNAAPDPDANRKITVAVP